MLLFLWLLTDAVLFIGAYVFAYFLRVGFILSTDFPIDAYIQTVFIITPMWLFILFELGVFRLFRLQSSRKNMTHILFSTVMGSALFTLAYYFLHGRFFSRLLLIEAALLNALFTMVWHVAFDQWQRLVLRRSPPAYPLLIIGTNRDAARFIRLLTERRSPLVPVGILDPEGGHQKTIEGVPVLGKLNVLEETIRTLKPTHLLQSSHVEHTINLMSVCRNHHLTYMLLPSVLGIIGTSEEFVNVEGEVLATVS
jgi:FlaA1/EpsC-like NDP-sugar epimerase